jgi:hypothetical protein
MSHGLGVMQRAILEALDPARTRCDDKESGRIGWYAVRFRGCEFVDDQYNEIDLSQIYVVQDTRRYLAHQLNATTQLYGWNNGGGLRKPVWEPTRKAPSYRFQASFTRALYGLIARQLLRPVIRLDEQGWSRLNWIDGLPRGRQRTRVEFVTKC